MEPSELDTALHAIHALPELEAARLERQLSPRLAETLASYRRVATILIDGLPDAAPALSPAVWNRISESAGIGTPGRGAGRRPRQR